MKFDWWTLSLWEPRDGIVVDGWVTWEQPHTPTGYCTGTDGLWKDNLIRNLIAGKGIMGPLSAWICLYDIGDTLGVVG